MDRQAFLNDAVKLRKYLKSGSSKRVAEIILQGKKIEN
jgi:hypothetical protein